MSGESVKAYVDNFLMHYASDNYDPIKAREYYLRTRELKGKEPKLETSTQHEAWGYASNQINEKRKAEKTLAATTQQEKLLKLSADAKASKERILTNLKERIAKINVETPIPKNASPKVKAFLTKQNAARKASARKEVQELLRNVSASVQSALNATRSSYTKTQTDLDDKYKSIEKTEYENIRTQVK